MRAPKAYNYTPRRSKALPIVEHNDLWICVLISKERDKRISKWSKKRIPWSANGSLFWWWNEKFEKNWKRYQEESKEALQRELQEELGDDFRIEKIFDLKESKNAVWEILTDTRGRLVWKKTKKQSKAKNFYGDVIMMS